MIADMIATRVSNNILHFICNFFINNIKTSHGN